MNEYGTRGKFSARPFLLSADSLKFSINSSIK